MSTCPPCQRQRPTVFCHLSRGGGGPGHRLCCTLVKWGDLLGPSSSWGPDSCPLPRRHHRVPFRPGRLALRRGLSRVPSPPRGPDPLCQPGSQVPPTTSRSTGCPASTPLPSGWGAGEVSFPPTAPGQVLVALPLQLCECLLAWSPVDPRLHSRGGGAQKDRRETPTSQGTQKPFTSGTPWCRCRAQWDSDVQNPGLGSPGAGAHDPSWVSLAWWAPCLIGWGPD